MNTDMLSLKDITSMFPEEIADVLSGLGEPAYRHGQIFTWLNKGIRDFSEMSNLPKSLRQKLPGLFRLSRPKTAGKRASKDGTEKLLWELCDGEKVESVVMDYSYGSTVCVSCQAGCRMGCKFCASAINGKNRDLTAGEILDQTLFSGLAANRKISRVVLMGIGEPMDNYENVIRYLKLVSHKDGLNIGMRHISLSTCGIIEGIDRLADENLGLTLSISLHAPDDETRGKIMPVNLKNPVRELVKAAERYYAATGRRVTFEYALIKGVNDTEVHAKLLSDLLKKGGWHVNIIPLNEVPEKGLKASLRADSEKFCRIIEKSGITFTVRRRMGYDIEAACGQLRGLTRIT